MRDRKRWLFLIVIAALTCLPACEPVDTAAVTLLREAVANNDVLTTKGELKVSFNAEGTIVTPWFTAYRGVGEDGPFFALETIKGRSLFDSASKPPQGRIHHSVRGVLLPGQGALTVDRIVEIVDASAFLAVHQISMVGGGGAPTVIAGRRVVHLRAVSKLNSAALRYDILVDAEKRYILAITESDSDGALHHAFEYTTIQYVAGPAQLYRPQSAVIRLKRQDATPAEAVRALGIPAARIFPQAAPAGFPRRRLVKTGALDAACLEFSNGTSTGIITVFVRKPRLQDVHIRPEPRLKDESPMLFKQRQARDLILSGRAFVDGQLIGVTYRVEDFDVVELHTSEKSILAMSLAGLEPIEELIGYFPLN